MVGLPWLAHRMLALTLPIPAAPRVVSAVVLAVTEWPSGWGVSTASAATGRGRPLAMDAPRYWSPEACLPSCAIHHGWRAPRDLGRGAVLRERRYRAVRHDHQASWPTSWWCTWKNLSSASDSAHATKPTATMSRAGSHAFDGTSGRRMVCGVRPEDPRPEVGPTPGIRGLIIAQPGGAPATGQRRTSLDVAESLPAPVARVTHLQLLPCADRGEGGAGLCRSLDRRIEIECLE